MFDISETDFYDNGPASYSPFPGLAAYNDENGPVVSFEAVGSRITCNPPPTNTDEDWLVLVKNVGRFVMLVEDSHGFRPDGSELLDDEGNDVFGDFASMSLGKTNLIITANEEFYRRFLAASSVAKRFNLLDKPDRVALFQAVLYGNACEQRTP